MPNCSFCGKHYDFPRGLTLVHVNGTIMYFCSAKCRKNKELGRDNKKVKWVLKRKKAAKDRMEEVEEETRIAKEKAETESDKKE